jgi:hypothetical protein
MKTIRRVILAVAFALIFAAGVDAQDSCRVKVVVAAVSWDGSGEPRFGVMSDNQIGWWRSEGQKKFPKICLVSTKDEADYGIAWKALQSADKYAYTVPNTSTTQHNGTVVGPGGVGTYSGTSTTTTDERREGEWPVTYVNAAVFKNGGDDIPLFVSKHKGQWRWSKPDKDAFVKSLEFINKQLK